MVQAHSEREVGSFDPERSDAAPSPARPSGFRCRGVFAGLGSLLLLAASLKSFQLIRAPFPPELLATTLATICFESCLGIWLLIGQRTRVTWAAAVFCFSCFSIVSGFKALTGESSCGCFGMVPVNPWLTLTIDLIAIGLLIWCRKEVVVANQQFVRRLQLVIPVCLALPLLVVGAAIHRQRQFSAADSNQAFASRLVLLTPNSWVNKSLPLIPHINIDADLSHGDWDVLLFRHDCHVCHEVMRQVESTLLTQPTTRPIALIAIDGDKSDELVERLRQLKCAVGFLSPTKEWFATTPVRLQLQDGLCLQANSIESW